MVNGCLNLPSIACEIVDLCESDNEVDNDSESDAEILENGYEHDDANEMEVSDNDDDDDDDDDETIFEEDDQEMPSSGQYSGEAEQEEDEDQNIAEDDSNEFEDREALKRSYVERADEIGTASTSEPCVQRGHGRKIPRSSESEQDAIETSQRRGQSG
ncbi:phosphopantothenoylcysteine decarboxylase subunit VHS3-like [Belonocnema kinseyi]|uniref:phosphopantothenoylcysteine decarboxylase subunit VHS3-like n=1 Tax=Belonocnema kinseyi TaxID=2817044 RepID=UPI00143D5B85|nr:phosphopantothenoylcysteine decarboxylase subunit VHS3-like [Belonocnema kinseyi]